MPIHKLQNLPRTESPLHLDFRPGGPGSQGNRVIAARAVYRPQIKAVSGQVVPIKEPGAEEGDCLRIPVVLHRDILQLYPSLKRKKHLTFSA